jgi:hypothetical protein
MEKDVKLDSINLKIGSKTIELTLEEAKKLKGILEDLFGKEVIKEIFPNIWYYRPYFVDYPVIKPSYEPYITYNATSMQNSLDITL